MTHVVITTINEPTDAVKHYASMGNDIELILVADRKSPASLAAIPATHLSVEAQEQSHHRVAALLPWNHYCRKNLGYLAAMERGATRIAETDDDNIPLSWDLSQVTQAVQGRKVRARGWVNIYRLFTDFPIWPRGFPLQHIVDSLQSVPETAPTLADCPVQQFLAAGDPDVDALYRLVIAKTDHEFTGEPVILEPPAVTPFNSQSTVWFPDAYMLMYLPSFVSFRMTDIWRSFVAQACLGAVGQSLAYHDAAVTQDRNEHDLMRDFKDEIPGYVDNARIWEVLREIALESNPSRMGDNLARCYEALHSYGWVPAEELKLVEAWIGDVASARG